MQIANIVPVSGLDQILKSVESSASDVDKNTLFVLTGRKSPAPAGAINLVETGDVVLT